LGLPDAHAPREAPKYPMTCTCNFGFDYAEMRQQKGGSVSVQGSAQTHLLDRRETLTTTANPADNSTRRFRRGPNMTPVSLWANDKTAVSCGP